MLEEDSEAIRSYHVCERRDCRRVFRDDSGYTDISDGQFDESRSSIKPCPVCGSILYLAEVDHAQKIEIWECPKSDCTHSEEIQSPSGR